MSGFQRAVKRDAKLRMAIMGPSGVGKSMTALIVASALADGRPVAVIDTERGSASKYADQFAFDVLELDDFHPQKYVQAVRDAVAAGYAVVIVDSLSHAWYGTNGLLELVAKQGKSFDAWGRVKPIENALIAALTESDIHVIVTMRTKTAYEVKEDEKSHRMTVQKIGTQAIQREGIEYEFDIVSEMDQLNTLTVSKSRCPALSGAVIPKPDATVAVTLRAWLSGAPALVGVSEPSATPVHRTPAPAPDPLISFTIEDNRPAPAPAPATKGGTKLGALRDRFLATGRTEQDWAAQCLAKTGTTQGREMKPDGWSRLVAYVEHLEHALQPSAEPPDLADIETTPVRP